MKTGRNEPCPCGSGKKYKKCCLEKDEQALIDQILEPRYAREGDEWEPEDEERIVNDHWDEESEDVEDNDTDEDDLDEEPIEDEDISDQHHDEITEPPTSRYSEPKLPEISEEENKLVDDWWEKYKKMNDTEKEREHLIAFINQYPHLVDHLGLWHEVLFEMGADHFQKGIYETFVNLLLRIRKEFPVTYRASYQYYDSDLIYWFAAQERWDEIDTFFDLFREEGKYDEKLDDVITFLHAINRTDILLASLAGSKCHKYASGIIYNQIVSRFLDKPESDEMFQTMANELLAEGLDAEDIETEKWKDRFMQYKRPFTPWDEKLPKKQSQAVDYYFNITNNFAYFLCKNTNLSFNDAIFVSDMLFDYYRRIVYHQRKMPAEIFCLDKNNMEKNAVMYYNTWFSYFDLRCFIDLNALYYFAVYLKTCGNISEEKQHELQEMIAEMYHQVLKITKGQGPEMLSFGKFPLWELKE